MKIAVHDSLVRELSSHNTPHDVTLLFLPFYTPHSVVLRCVPLILSFTFLSSLLLAQSLWYLHLIPPFFFSQFLKTLDGGVGNTAVLMNFLLAKSSVIQRSLSLPGIACVTVLFGSLGVFLSSFCHSSAAISHSLVILVSPLLLVSMSSFFS